MKTIYRDIAMRRAPFSLDGEKARMRGTRNATQPLTPTLSPSGARGTAGFTLIELLIAIGIFAVFITIITGVFTNFIQVQRHAIAQGQLISDMTSALEAFIKEVRTGYGSTYTVEEGAIAFVNQNKNCITFRVIEEQFQRADAGEQDGCSPEDSSSSRFTPLTSNKTKITELTFDSVPAESDNNILQNQGVITIKFTATSTKDGISPISIQNSVTSRQMEPYATE